MPWGLKRFQQQRCLHFITFSCYRREPLLGTPRARDIFEAELERARRWYGFFVSGYVVMPEHVHLLVSEPERKPLAVAIQILKQNVSRQLRRRGERQFWHTRYYDFPVSSEKKRLEKLHYIHQNPVTRGLVQRPEDWQWSSFVHIATGREGTVEIESQWTAHKRERVESCAPSGTPPPCRSKPRSDKGGATSKVVGSESVGQPPIPGVGMRCRWSRFCCSPPRSSEIDSPPGVGRDIVNMTSFAAASVAVRVGIFLAVLLAASLWRIFKKAGRPGWPALVPFYNGYITVEIAGKPGWWILLYLVPIVDIVVAAIVNVELARKFGKSTGFGVGLLLLPFIFYPMLADGDAAYVVADAADGSGGTTVPGRRGALLSASLIWFLASAVIGTVALLVTLFSHSLSVAGGSTALPVFLNVAVLIGLVGIWKWRKWGVYLFFLADLMMVAVSMRVSLMAAPAYRMTVPGLLLVLAGEALLLALFAWAVWRAWSHFDVAEEPHLAIKTPAGMAAAAGTGRVEVHLSGDRETDLAPFRKLAFKGEIIRFLTSERTKSYEQQSGAWWSREDLKLVVVKKYSSDCAPDVLFREAETAIDELARQGEIVGTPSGYRAK